MPEMIGDRSIDDVRSLVATDGELMAMPACMELPGAGSEATVCLGLLGWWRTIRQRATVDELATDQVRTAPHVLAQCIATPPSIRAIATPFCIFRWRLVLA